MTTDLIQWAVQVYLDREIEANATMQGADHERIMREVAEENGLTVSDLRSAILDATNMSGVM